MRQTTYLNVILTVNAAVLTGLLWTHVVQQPLLAQTASAQTPSTKTGANADGSTGIPNAADQRQKILEAIRDLKTTVDGTRKIVESGRMRVEVTNFDQISRKVEVTNIDQLKPKQ